MYGSQAMHVKRSTSAPAAPPPVVHCCKPWDSTGVVRPGTGAGERVSSVVRALLVGPVRAVGPGAFGGRRAEGRPLESAVRTGRGRQQWSYPCFKVLPQPEHSFMLLLQSKSD